MAKLPLDKLTPFQTAVFARHKDGKQVDMAKLRVELRRQLDVVPSNKTGERRERAVTIDVTTNESVLAMHYSVIQQASWAAVGLPHTEEVSQELAVVLSKGEWVALTLTEGARRAALVRRLRDKNLLGLKLADPARVRAALVSDAARTLWLKGAHRPAAVKPDNKVLTGRSLKDALDPIADQTYRYTALRCEPQATGLPSVIGVAADQARYWGARSDDWSEFLTATESALDAVAAAQPGPDPLPVLAQAGVSLSGVASPFDLGITPPELWELGPADRTNASQLEALEELAYHTEFEVLAGGNAHSLKATVSWRSTVLGELELSFSEAGQHIKTKAIGAEAPGLNQVQSDHFEQVRRRCREPEALSVYFESGHCITDGQVCAIRHRDVSFNGFEWVDFVKPSFTDLKKEKPAPGKELGKDDSLFCWVFNQWPLAKPKTGWLVCDDRPGETCDFIHVDNSDQSKPVLTLIHAKAAKSAAANRGIAVVPYETVCSQAIKNLRHLDATLLSDGVGAATAHLAADAEIYKDGKKRKLGQFQTMLAGLSANLERHVVVLQPHVRQTAFSNGAKAKGHARTRFQQLNTLLVGAQANVRSLGAEFTVVSDQL